MNTGTEGLKVAKRIVQYAAMGIVPSQERAALARSALAGHLHANGAAMRVLSASEMGVLPNVPLCREAEQQISALLEHDGQAQGDTDEEGEAPDAAPRERAH